VTKNKSDFNNSSGNMELDGVHLMAYGTYYQSESFYLDGLIKLGSNDYATRRRVSRNEKPLQEAAGDTDGLEYSMSLSGGYDYNQGGFSYGPYGRLSYTRAEIDAFTESASNPGAPGIGSVLSLSDQEVDSATAVLGGQVSYAISRPSGVFMPQARMEWEHEFSDGSRELSAQFVHDPSSSTFTITTDEPDRDYLNLGLGVSVVTAQGRSGFLYYETRLDQDSITQNWIKAGVRLEFR
jgi:outer membrane autotransporter protein